MATTPTNITPPRVPITDGNGMMTREWYRFILSLWTTTIDNQQDAAVAPSASALLASYDALLATMAQASEAAPADGSAEVEAGLNALAQSVEAAPRQDIGTLASYNVSNVPYLGFGAAPPWMGSAAGQVWYDTATGSFNVQMGGGNITQQVGEELFFYGKASAAITDSPFQIVYQTGTVGASGVIRFAPTVAGITNGDLIIGAATEPIATNGFGRITSYGIIHGITTDGAAYGETWADGNTIWYNPVTGNPTNIKPAAPNIKVQVGTIIKASPGGSGSIQIEINHGSVLGGTDSNVQFTSVADRNVIQYDATLGYWKNVPDYTLTQGNVVTRTSNFTMPATASWAIIDHATSTTVTLPAASSFTNRAVMFKSLQAGGLVSASANVIPLGGGAAGTAILAAAAGKWATLVSDGTNWNIMQAN